MNHEEYCDELDREVDRFAGALAGADALAMVPSCPEWNVRDLTGHLGRVHRWAEQLVRLRATQRMALQGDFSDVTFDDEWLREGGRALSATLRAADPDAPMWAWGTDQHVRFWSRRQLHETLVHRIDLELALGVDSEVAPAIAIDAIDEFFANMTADADITVKARPSHSRGERLAIKTADDEARWNVVLGDGGYEFVDELEGPDAVVSGAPGELLALVLRRRPLAECDVTIEGDPTLVEHWLAGTAFQ